MTQARWLLLFLILCWPLAAGAGPWPRAEGKTFLSFSIETELENGTTNGDELYGTFYAEYGLTSRLTIGLDAGAEEEDFDKVIGFVRWPIGQTSGPNRLAAEFGLGYFDGTFALRPGLSWGRNVTAGTVPGWATIDSRVTVTNDIDTVLQTDFTLGLKTTQKSIILLQVQTTAASTSDAFAKLAPSYIRQLKPGRYLEVGLTAGIIETDEFKLKLGLWREF